MKWLSPHLLSSSHSPNPPAAPAMGAPEVPRGALAILQLSRRGCCNPKPGNTTGFPAHQQYVAME